MIIKPPFIRVFRNDTPGDDGGSGTGDVFDVELPAGDEPEQEDEPTGRPAGDEPPTGRDDGEPGDEPPPTDEDDAEEEWKNGETVHKAKRSDLRKVWETSRGVEERVSHLTQRETQVSQTLQHLGGYQQQAIQQLNAGLAQMQQALVGEAPDRNLIATNPQEYMRQDVIWRDKLQQFQHLTQMRDQVQGQNQQLQQSQMQQRRTIEETTLLNSVPEWRDPTARKAEGVRISGDLTRRGFSPDEVGGIVDHRIILLARDAMRWQQYQATQSKRVPPAKPVPRAVKPGAAPSSVPQAKTANVRQFNERLSRNPNDEGALHGLLSANGF